MDRSEKLKVDNRRTRLMIIVSGILILMVVAVLLRGVLWPSSPVAIDPTPEPPQVVTPPVEPDPPPPPVEVIPKLPGALLVAIDNKSEARPHSGLENADLVYEMLAEYRITRFLAVFYTKEVPDIGPVRSARYYSAQLAAAYHTPYAHCGGSTDGLQLIRDLKIPDLDEITNSQEAFRRDESRNAPHNLYTSTELMLAESKRRGLTITPLPEIVRGGMDNGATTEYMKIVYSVRNPSLYLIDYQVEWKWQDGVFTRFMNQKPHITKDENLITAENVVIVSVNHRDVVANGTWRTEMDLIGSGDAVFLRDGVSYSGTWNKTSATDHFEFTVGGEVYKFAPGNIWIQIVPGMDAVTY